MVRTRLTFKRVRTGHKARRRNSRTRRNGMKQNSVRKINARTRRRRHIPPTRRINNSKIINLVAFYSEGPPHDNGLDLSTNKQLFLKKASPHFNNITIYTPSIMRNMKLDKYVKEHMNTGLVSMNPGMSKVGFGAWKPKILLLELDKLKDGDILIYRDCNIKKYHTLGYYRDIRNIAQRSLCICGFDFFIPRENKKFKLRQFTKTNVIRELGENHIFTYEFPNLQVGLLTVVRKSKISMEIIQEWENACLNDKWINGKQYGKLDKEFRWSCPEQSLLGVIISNWVRNGKYGISRNYPRIGFRNRDIYKIRYYDKEDEYNYLNLL